MYKRQVQDAVDAAVHRAAVVILAAEIHASGALLILCHMDMGIDALTGVVDTALTNWNVNAAVHSLVIDEMCIRDRRQLYDRRDDPVDGTGPALCLPCHGGTVPEPAVPLHRDRKSTRLNSSHSRASRMPSSA